MGYFADAAEASKRFFKPAMEFGAELIGKGGKASVEKGLAQIEPTMAKTAAETAAEKATADAAAKKATEKAAEKAADAPIGAGVGKTAKTRSASYAETQEANERLAAAAGKGSTTAEKQAAEDATKKAADDAAKKTADDAAKKTTQDSTKKTAEKSAEETAGQGPKTKTFAQSKIEAAARAARWDQAASIKFASMFGDGILAKTAYYASRPFTYIGIGKGGAGSVALRGVGLYAGAEYGMDIINKPIETSGKVGVDAVKGVKGAFALAGDALSWTAEALNSDMLRGAADWSYKKGIKAIATGAAMGSTAVSSGFNEAMSDDTPDQDQSSPKKESKTMGKITTAIKAGKAVVEHEKAKLEGTDNPDPTNAGDDTKAAAPGADGDDDAENYKVDATGKKIKLNPAELIAKEKAAKDKLESDMKGPDGWKYALGALMGYDKSKGVLKSLPAMAMFTMIVSAFANLFKGFMGGGGRTQNADYSAVHQYNAGFQSPVTNASGRAPYGRTNAPVYGAPNYGTNPTLLYGPPQVQATPYAQAPVPAPQQQAVFQKTYGDEPAGLQPSGAITAAVPAQSVTSRELTAAAETQTAIAKAQQSSKDAQVQVDGVVRVYGEPAPVTAPAQVAQAKRREMELTPSLG